MWMKEIRLICFFTGSVVMDHLMICGQSLQALALRFARASQAGSVETWVVSPGGKRFVTSFVAGGDGVESVISTFKKKEKICFSCDFKFVCFAFIVCKWTNNFRDCSFLHFCG